MKIIIILPAYNAAKTIQSVFKRIPKNTLKEIYRFIIVNDGSTDATQKICEKLRKVYKKITIITHKKNKGYARAQKIGFKKALVKKADIIGILHSDGQYAPEFLPRLLQPLKDGYADVVLGSRMLGGGALKGGMPLYKYLGNKFLTLIENIAYEMKLSEYHSGYMLYSKKTLTTINFERLSNTYHFDGEMLIMAKKKKLKILEIPIPTIYGNEKSYLNSIIYGIDVLKIVFRYLMGKYDF